MSSRAGRRKRAEQSQTHHTVPPTANADGTDLRGGNLRMLWNAIMTRSSFLRGLMDKRRDLDDECGWPKTENVTVQNYRDLYDRHPLASRVVEFWPSECWKVEPNVYEDEDPEVATPFEKAWDSLGSQLRGNSFHKQESGSPVWEYLHRLDRLSGVGHFGVMLIGLNDGQELSQPAAFREGQQVTFLRVFDESLVEISQYETDRKNPRYGQPVLYNLTFNDPRNNQQAGDGAEGNGAVGLTTQNQYVHWSRIVHVADNLGSSEVFGVPRCRPVLNPLLDTQKIYGSSAEGYYKAAFNALSLETNPALGGDVEIDGDDLRNQIEQFQNGLQRILALKGMVANSIAPVATDPAAHIETQIDAICIQLNAPKRKFMGSERGELASSQDAEDLDSRTMGRRRGHCTPRIIVPFTDRLITLGVLPEPAEGYCVYWPEPETVTETEQATIALQKVDAMSKYVQGNVEDILPLPDFFARFMGLSDEEAQAIVEGLDSRSDNDKYTEPDEPELPAGGFNGPPGAGGFPNGE